MYNKTAWTETVAITPERLNNLETQYESVQAEIEEMGTNSNGTYIKYKNGLLECFTTAKQQTANVANGPLFNSDILTFTYPAAFITSKPVMASVHTFGVNRWGVTTSDPTSSGVGVRQFSTISSNTLISAYVYARGWWK